MFQSSIRIQEIHQGRLSSSSHFVMRQKGNSWTGGDTLDCYDGEQPQTHAARTAPRLIFHELFLLRTTLPPHVPTSKHAGTWYSPRKTCECNTPSRRPQDTTKYVRELQTGFTLHIFSSLHTLCHTLPLPAIAVLYVVNLFAWALGVFSCHSLLSPSPDSVGFFVLLFRLTHFQYKVFFANLG